MMFLTGLFVILSFSAPVLISGRIVRPCSDNSAITVEVKYLTETCDDMQCRDYSTLEIRNLQSGATVCFLLKTPNGNKEYAVKLEEVSGSTNIQDGYEFGVPNVTAKCTCSCSDKTNVLKECNAEEAGFCDGYSLPDGRCVPINSKTEVTKGCTGLLTDSNLCCAIRMKNSDMKSKRFKAFKIRDQQQTSVKIKLFSSYSQDTAQLDVIDEIEEEQVVQLNEDDIDFKDIKVTVEGSRRNRIFTAGSWYIGQSNPFSPTVYETSRKVNLKDDYDISKVGWVKYSDGKYQLGRDRFQDSDIEKVFTATVRDCGLSLISSSFPSIDMADFNSSLEELSSKHSTYVEEVSWKNKGLENHGQVSWTYKKSAFNVDVNFRLEGLYTDFEVFRKSIVSKIGGFKAGVIVSQHGESYIEINMTDSSGTIFGSYTIGNEDPLEFSFEVTNKTFYLERYVHADLQCMKNANGKLCLNIKDQEPRCETVLCEEKKIDDSDINNSTIDTDTVVSEDPLNWRTWAKYANPLEWFNGISSYQEAIMLVIELLGMLGGVFLVLKILRMLNLLGKCCRCMFCCFLCPKTEKKIRDRASTMKRSYRRRMTATKRRFTETFKRDNRVSSEGSEDVKRKKSLRERTSVRIRLNTEAAVQYLRKKLGGGEQIPATNEYELETGIPTKPRPPSTIDEGEEENGGHVNQLCQIEEEEKQDDKTKETVSKTVSFKKTITVRELSEEQSLS